MLTYPFWLPRVIGMFFRQKYWGPYCLHIFQSEMKELNIWLKHIASLITFFFFYFRKHKNQMILSKKKKREFTHSPVELGAGLYWKILIQWSLVSKLFESLKHRCSFNFMW